MTTFKLARPLSLPSMAGSVSVSGDLDYGWMTAAVGEWAQISGTTVPAGVGNFSGVGFRDDETAVEVFFSLYGGHSSGINDNSVKTVRLDADVPSVTTRLAASDTTGLATDGSDAYMPSDGRPVCRHTYHSVHWVPEVSGYMVGGCYWGSGGTNDTWPYIDVFEPSGASGGDWRDVPGPSAWASTPAAPGGLNAALLSVRNPATGLWYSTVNQSTPRLDIFNPNTNAWTTATLSGATHYSGGGSAWDTSRGKIYNLCSSGWFAGSSTINSVQITTAGVVTAITLSGSALSQFTTAVPNFMYSAMEYDEARDCFYFYNGQTYYSSVPGNGSGERGAVYVITPNGTTTWDISLLSTSGTPPPSWGQGGVCGRMKYIPRWNCLIVAYPGQNLYYLRVA